MLQPGPLGVGERLAGSPDLVSAAKELLGLELGRSQLEAFGWYAAELLAWNRRFNLSAVTDPAEIAVKHILDSLTCTLAMEGGADGRLIDVGTGAGFPGIPLKIACPKLKLTLVESIGKKAEFCRHVARELELHQVQVIKARAEEVGQDPQHRAGYDWATARAVARMPVLVEYLIPLLRIGGRAIAQKGESGPAEAQAAEKAIRLLGGELGQLIRIELPGVVESRYLVVVAKLAATPAQYPRRPGVPARRPLAG